MSPPGPESLASDSKGLLALRQHDAAAIVAKPRWLQAGERGADWLVGDVGISGSTEQARHVGHPADDVHGD
jgi:hypothetical protein